jgi:hypothetical protein
MSLERRHVVVLVAGDEMKPVNVFVIAGALAVAGLGAWYMFMQSSPQYQKSAQRGLDPALLPASAAAAPSSAAAAPSSAPAAPSSAAAAPTEAPAAAPSSAPAAPSSATP